MSKQLRSYIIMNSNDNCATALIDLFKNSKLQLHGGSIRINQNIPMGHKFALNNITDGDLVKQYGQSIGVATKEIKKGDWIHTHNLTSQYIPEVLKE